MSGVGPLSFFFFVVVVYVVRVSKVQPNTNLFFFDSNKKCLVVVIFLSIARINTCALRLRPPPLSSFRASSLTSTQRATDSPLAAAAAGPAETRAVAGCVSEPQRGCRTATAPLPEHSGRVTGAVGTYTRRIAPKIGRETALRAPAPAAPPNVSLPPGRGARRWPTMVLQFSLVLGRRSG